MEYVRDPGSLVPAIEKWMADYISDAGAKGIAVGLSGGIDSAVVAALGKRVFGNNMMALVMPCHSNPSDASDAYLLAEHFSIPCRTIDLSSTYDRLTETVEREIPLSEISRANIKARLRMVTLYGVGQSMSYLVCGTSNRAELEVGYFTKYGDSASDLLPLADLLKAEVRSIAKWLGIPGSIVTKAPTAGLWSGQTDENEMGFTYEELDRFIATGEASPDVRARIEKMRKQSEHKRRPAPIWGK